MMYQIRLRFYGTWQMTTWQRGGGPRLTDHPVITTMQPDLSMIRTHAPRHGSPTPYPPGPDVPMRAQIVIDYEAGEIIHPLVCVSVCLFVRALHSQKHRRVFISRSIQNGVAFKMVVISTVCTIAVDHAFN